MPDERKRILILGGTVEARNLANTLVSRGRHDVITSFAGATTTRKAPKGEVHVGGFGGTEGLRTFIERERIDLVADTTHPFAARISANAAAASHAAGIACFRLDRPPWEPQPGDDWCFVADIDACVEAIPAGANVFVTVGRQEIGAFFARDDIRVVARMIEPPALEVPAHAELVLARPPFSLDEERALIDDKKIDLLVSKNSGGESTRTKLTAAREFSLPVIMIERPAKPATVAASCVEDIITLIDRHFA